MNFQGQVILVIKYRAIISQFHKHHKASDVWMNGKKEKNTAWAFLFHFVLTQVFESDYHFISRISAVIFRRKRLCIDILLGKKSSDVRGHLYTFTASSLYKHTLCRTYSRGKRSLWTAPALRPPEYLSATDWTKVGGCADASIYSHFILSVLSRLLYPHKPPETRPAANYLPAIMYTRCPRHDKPPKVHL